MSTLLNLTHLDTKFCWLILTPAKCSLLRDIQPACMPRFVQLLSYISLKTQILLVLWHYCRKWNQRTRSNRVIPNQVTITRVRHHQIQRKESLWTVPHESHKLSEKLEALRSYRKANNLCFTCGDPWARGHKCRDKVPLHIMEDLLEVLHLNEPPDPQHLSDSSSDKEVMLVTTAFTPVASDIFTLIHPLFKPRKWAKKARNQVGMRKGMEMKKEAITRRRAR